VHRSQQPEQYRYVWHTTAHSLLSASPPRVMSLLLCLRHNIHMHVERCDHQCVHLLLLVGPYTCASAHATRCEYGMFVIQQSTSVFACQQPAENASSAGRAQSTAVSSQATKPTALKAGGHCHVLVFISCRSSSGSLACTCCCVLMQVPVEKVVEKVVEVSRTTC
jgi:hypothetical protein